MFVLTDMYFVHFRYKTNIIGMFLYDYKDISCEYIYKLLNDICFLHIYIMYIDGKSVSISDTNIYICKQHNDKYWYQISFKDKYPVDFIHCAELYSDPNFKLAII